MASELVTQAEYARRCGISKQAVNKRTVPQGGPIPLHGPRKLIDVDEANTLWNSTLTPRQYTNSRYTAPAGAADAGGPDTGAEPASEGAGGEPPAGVSQEAQAAVEDTLAGDPTTGQAAKNAGPAAQAKVATAIIRAQTEKINLERLRGKLIDKTAALRQAFSYSRKIRDAWLNWPASVGPILAAELGADPHTTTVALERLVREHLNELSDQHIDIG